MNIFKKTINKSKYLRSMRFAILVFAILVGIVPIILVNIIQLTDTEDNMVKQKMDRLIGQCNIIRSHIVTNNYFENPDDIAVNVELSQLSSMHDGRVILTDKNFRIVYDTYMMDINKICISESVIKSFDGQTISYYNKDEQYIAIAMPLVNNDETIGTMLMTFSTYDILRSINDIKYTCIVIDLILIVIIVTISIFVSKLLSEPFKEIEKSIEEISEGYLEKKLDIKGYTETRQIAEAFNQMLEKIKKVDDSRQEFVSNVSHELKTPMTSIKVLADSIVMQENVPVELYKEFMQDIVEEIDRENEIISDLLSLVRMDKKSSGLNISEVNINEMVELILKRLRPIAAKRNIELVMESFRPITAQIDEVKLTSAITNLVENAIKYNVMDGWVHVSLNADYKYFYVKVEDSGIGIPEESQEMIFERFYRVDKTRARETGGTGLGLAITKNIILMHRGAVKVYSKENEGTTFTVRIPLNYVKVVKISKNSIKNRNGDRS